jgi:hypothetical protein
MKRSFTAPSANYPHGVRARALDETNGRMGAFSHGSGNAHIAL